MQCLPVKLQDITYRVVVQKLHNILIKPIAKHLPKNPDERAVFTIIGNPEQQKQFAAAGKFPSIKQK